MFFRRYSHHAIVMYAVFFSVVYAGQRQTIAQPTQTDSQTSFVQPGTHMIVSWRARDGLPGNFFYGSIQDASGYLWIHSLQGLTRFDGNTFEHLPPSIVEGWDQYDNVSNVCEDQSGRIWFSAANYSKGNGGVYLLDMTGHPYTATSVTNEARFFYKCMRDNQVLVIQDHMMNIYSSPEEKKEIPIPFSNITKSAFFFEDLDVDEVIIATSDSLLHYKNGTIQYVGPQWEIGRQSEGEITKRKGKSGIYEFVKTDWGELFLLTHDEVYTFSDSLLTPVRTDLEGNRVFFDEGVSNLWYNHSDSLYRIMQDTVLTYPFHHNGIQYQGVGYVFEIEGEIYANWRLSWFESRLYHLNQHNEWLSVGLEKFNVKVFNGITRDFEKGLWVTTDQGLFQVLPRKMQVYTPDQGLADLQVLALSADNEGGVWASVWGDGVQRLYNNRWEHYTTNDGLLNNHILAFQPDADGSMWVGTLNGLVKIHNGSVKEVYPFDFTPRRMYLNDLHLDQQGRLWVATAVNLFEFKDQEYHPVWADRNRNVKSLYEDHDGVLWATFMHAGVSRRNASGEWEDVHFPYVSDHGVSAMTQDKRGTYWFSTVGAGLVRVDDGDAFAYTTEHGLPTDIIKFAMDDGFGNLWLGSDLGVLSISHGDLENVYRGKSEKLNVTILSEIDGLPGDEIFPGASGHFQAADGNLWIATMGGIAVIDPRDIPVNDQHPQIHIQLFDVQGVSKPVESGHSFRPGSDNAFTFEFATLSLRENRRKEYKYRLLGESNEWKYYDEDRVTFNKLPPGQYTFEVHGSNNDGFWSKEPARMSFTVLPYFYQTWWFWTLIVWMALGVLFLWISQIHYRNSLKLIKQRHRIADDLHDDIGSKIGAVAHSLEFINRKEELTEMDRKELARQVKLSQDLVNELRDTVWIITPNQDTLSELIERMKVFTHSIAASLDLEFKHTRPIPDQSVDLEWKRNVYFLFKEAVHNAVRHARATSILVNVAIMDRKIRFVVKDDGCGMERNTNTGGRGMDTMERRALAAGGVLEIESKIGHGTAVIFVAPMP